MIDKETDLCTFPAFQHFCRIRKQKWGSKLHLRIKDGVIFLLTDGAIWLSLVFQCRPKLKLGKAHRTHVFLSLKGFCLLGTFYGSFLAGQLRLKKHLINVHQAVPYGKVSFWNETVIERTTFCRIRVAGRVLCRAAPIRFCFVGKQGRISSPGDTSGWCGSPAPDAMASRICRARPGRSLLIAVTLVLVLGNFLWMCKLQAQAPRYSITESFPFYWWSWVVLRKAAAICFKTNSILRTAIGNSEFSLKTGYQLIYNTWNEFFLSGAILLLKFGKRGIHDNEISKKISFKLIHNTSN